MPLGAGSSIRFHFNNRSACFCVCCGYKKGCLCMLVLAHAACQFDSGRMWQFLYAVVWAKTPTERFVCQLFTSFFS